MAALSGKDSSGRIGVLGSRIADSPAGYFGSLTFQTRKCLREAAERLCVDRSVGKAGASARPSWSVHGIQGSLGPLRRFLREGCRIYCRRRRTAGEIVAASDSRRT